MMIIIDHIFTSCRPQSRRVTKTDKDISRLDFKNIKFSVKIRDIPKIEQKNYITVSIFCYKNKKKISNLCIMNVHLILIEEGKGHCSYQRC